MYRQHVQYLLNFAFEDVFPEKKMGENFNSSNLSFTWPGPHSSQSSPWNFDLLFELNSSPIEPEGILIRLLPNYYCIIVFTFCLKLFFLAGKSWPFSCEFPSSLLDASSRTNVTFSEFRPFDCKKYMIVPTILNKCIKQERGEPKGKHTRQITFLILKMPK